MAEVLVCAYDRPVSDSGGRWYRGMPVVVMPDGHRWGKKERPPRFVVMKFPQLTLREAREVFLEPDTELTDAEILDPETGEPTGEMMELRLLHARMKNVIPEARVAQALAADGTVTIQKRRTAVEAQEREPVTRRGDPIVRETEDSIQTRNAAARARGLNDGD